MYPIIDKVKTGYLPSEGMEIMSNLSIKVVEIMVDVLGAKEIRLISIRKEQLDRWMQ